ncbi:outer membrane protein assembly factor BamA [Paraburkholderia caribensis]|uniref:outer membrane protein assembly factor BamA n=1 Tax=Paraburkholderia caribensis TaxID=75105 RepID=UPI003F560338
MQTVRAFCLNSIFMLLTLLSSPEANARQALVVRDITIEGLKHVRPETLLAALPLKKGDAFSENTASLCLQSIYDTGLIADATVGVQGENVVFHVVERPVLDGLEFAGLHEFEKDKLAKLFRDIGVGKGKPFDKALLGRAVQTLKNSYLARGLLTVQVETTTTPVGRDRVSLLISVIEGPIAKIRQVTVIGNEAFSDHALFEAISLRPTNWSTWYTKNDVFSKETLAADVDRLQKFYLDRGYVEFSITSVQASLTPDGTGVDLTVVLHEGVQHKIEAVKLSGELLGRDTELESLMGIRPRETYSASKISSAKAAIAERLGRYGYGFADVQVTSQTNPDRHTVDLTFVVTPRHRLYVRRVNIEGNTRTRDEIIRREMLQLESAWYDSGRLAKSRDRISRLGFFSSVDIRLVPVEASVDQVDINVVVGEQKTGAFRLSAGSSSSDVFYVSAGISEDNIFGSGRGLSIKLDTSKANRQLSVREYSPYVTQDGISRSSEVHYAVTRLNGKKNESDVRITSLGGDIKFGIPFSEDSKVLLGVAFEQNRYETNKNAPRIYQDQMKRLGSVVNNVPLSAAWVCDTRDSPLVPSRGYMLQMNTELGTPVGDTIYYRGDLRGQYYYSFAKGLVVSANIEAGFGQGILGTPYPIAKRYFAGGIGSVRGYKAGSLGPKDLATGDSIGGSRFVVGNVEMTVPLPGSGWDRTLRVFSFLDGGNVWGDGGGTSGANGLRYSCGAGLEWLSPIGPLKLSLSVPLVQHEGDELEKFQFQIGTSF